MQESERHDQNPHGDRDLGGHPVVADQSPLRGHAQRNAREECREIGPWQQRDVEDGHQLEDRLRDVNVLGGHRDYGHRYERQRNADPTGSRHRVRGDESLARFRSQLTGEQRQYRHRKPGREHRDQVADNERLNHCQHNQQPAGPQQKPPMHQRAESQKQREPSAQHGDRHPHRKGWRGNVGGTSAGSCAVTTAIRHKATSSRRTPRGDVVTAGSGTSMTLWTPATPRNGVNP